MFQALQNIYEIADKNFPVTIYYAFKQQDTEGDGKASTGWETMLNALIRAGFQITATLPMRTEMKTRVRSHESNALASSIVLACRKRPIENKNCDKGSFLQKLKTLQKRRANAIYLWLLQKKDLQKQANLLRQKKKMLQGLKRKKLQQKLVLIK